MCYVDVSFWKQLFVLTATLTTSISAGVTLSFSGALNPALLAANGTDIRATKEQASWIAAVLGISGVPCFIFFPIVMQVFGRKAVIILINLLQFLGWIITLFANNITWLFLARIIQGFAAGCPMVTAMIIGEYADPKRRAYFMVIKKLVVSSGVLLCHFLNVFWSWRQIAGFCLLFNIFGILFIIFCPESPAYLALNGKFEACEKAYVWLNGKNCNKKELFELIAAQKERLKNYVKDSNENKTKAFTKRFLKPDFQKAFVIAILLAMVIETFGRHFFMAYFVQMMNELFHDTSKSLYFSIGNDCLTVTALAIAGIVITLFKRRKLLFVSGSISILIMLVLSVLSFFRSQIGITGIWTAFAILFYSFVTNIGVIPTAYSFYGEVFPLEHRSVGASVTGIAFSCITGVSLKVSPMVMENVGLSGTFLICAASALLILVILYFLLPETTNKTLLEIEYEMKGIERPCSIESMPMKV